MKQFQNNLLLPNAQSGLPAVKVQFLSRLKKCLYKNLDNTDLVAIKIANDMAISKSTLNRRLKSILNLTISECTKQYRLQRSIEFLHAGYKVKEVSQQVGFKTPSYFAQCFKLYYQRQPSEVKAS